MGSSASISRPDESKRTRVERKSRLCSVIASCFALSAFTVAILAGLFSGNGAGSVLARAAMAIVVCYPVGLLVGLICERVVDNQLAALADDAGRATPPVSSPAGPSAEAKDEGEQQ